MRNLISTILLLGFLCPNLIFSQSISGKVVDQHSKETLPFANVVLLKSDIQVMGTTTDFDGNYTLTGFDPGTYDLKVVYVGYTDQEITGITVMANQTLKIDIELSSGGTLTEIVVMEYRMPLIHADNTSSGQTITYSDIRSRTPGRAYSNNSGRKKGKKKQASSTGLPTRSVSTIVSTTSGLSSNVREDGNFSVRGSRSGDNIIYVDGVRVRGSSIPASDIEQLEVITGGLPANYGETSDRIMDIDAINERVIKERSRTERKKKPNKEPIAQNWNTEDYAPIVENEYKEVAKEPLSTFSIDVDRAAYSNIRRIINNNQMPVANSVRIEEMINYFDYDYPQPESEHPFEIITELAGCPWNEDHQLVHIGLQGEQLSMEEAPANNLVFLIDVSGSMAPSNKLPLLTAAFRLLVDNMRAKDRIAIVVYAGAAGLVLPSTPGTQKTKIKAALESLQAGGSTAGGAGIQLAYKIAKENFVKNGNNRVILASDGDFNIGVSSDADLLKLIENKRDDDIFLTVLGFGMHNLKDNKMELMADKGNGNYAYIDNIREAKKMLVTEITGTLYTIAKDVKLQIEFNPVYVSAFRLIGYENRILEHEDFNDDKKDAGELGAGHTVTAIYEIIPKGKRTKGAVKPIDDLKYQELSISEGAASSEELINIKFRYKSPTGTKSQLIKHPVGLEQKSLEETSDNFRFSAAVAGFGLLLRDSRFKGDLTYEKVVKLAQGAMGEDQYGYRAEFVSLVETGGLLYTAER